MHSQGKEHVQEVEGVATKQERHYRQVRRPITPYIDSLTRPFKQTHVCSFPTAQYMNRKGGFNRCVSVCLFRVSVLRR